MKEDRRRVGETAVCHRVFDFVWRVTLAASAAYMYDLSFQNLNEFNIGVHEKETAIHYSYDPVLVPHPTGPILIPYGPCFPHAFISLCCWKVFLSF